MELFKYIIGIYKTIFWGILMLCYFLFPVFLEIIDNKNGMYFLLFFVNIPIGIALIYYLSERIVVEIKVRKIDGGIDETKQKNNDYVNPRILNQ